MATGVGDSAVFDGTTLLARFSDSNEETTDTDDSFDYLEAGMAEGELYEVSSSCSDAVDSSASDDDGDFGEGSDFAYDPSLPGPSSGPVGTGNFSSDSSSGMESDNSSDDSTSDLSSASSGRPSKHAKRRKKPAKTWKNGAGFVPKAFKTFDDSNVGIQAPYKLPVDAKEVEYFKLFFDGELLGDIKSETNRYADQLLANPTARTKTLRDWVGTTVDELYAIFALIILMGVVVKKSMKDYWCKRAATKTPFFPEVFSRKRFLQILRALHFVDNSSVPPGPRSDRLWKIRPAFDFLVDRFSSIFMPGKNLCIDESLLLWKGRLFFKQYIPKKRNRFGINFFYFVIVKLDTFFVSSFIQVIKMQHQCG